MTEAALYQISENNKRGDILAPLKQDIWIGRSNQSHLKLEDWKCSGIHAIIKRDSKNLERYTIVDLGSYHGTRVNQKKINAHQLKHGDVITIGDKKFSFCHVKKAPQEAPALNTPHSPEYSQGKIDQLFRSKVELSVLEVGMYWGSQLLEAKSFPSDSAISIGNSRISTFDIPLIAEGFVGEDFEVARYEGGILKFRLPPSATGILWTETGTVAIDTLRYFDPRYKGKDIIEVDCRIGDRAHIEFGELALSFKFVEPTESIKPPLFPKLDDTILKIFGGIVAFYLLLAAIFTQYTPEPKERTLADIPEHLKKTVYNSGIKRAKEQRKSAIGQLANEQGGRAKAEEGKSSAKKAPKKKKKKSVKKKVAKKKPAPPQQKAREKPKKKLVAQRQSAKKETVAQKPKKLDMDAAFASAANSQAASSTTIVSKVKKRGNTASALTESGFARGKAGLGAGGGGKSVGIGALKGSATGGGLGAGDYGLKASSGVEIRIPENERISMEDGLDPDVIAARIKKYLPQIQHCYEQQLVYKPDLKGKVTVGFTIIGNGSVRAPKVTQTSLRDKATESCMIGKIKDWTFPRPKGGGTVGVNYPFILMSNQGN